MPNSKSAITLLNSTSSRFRFARTFLRLFSRIKSQRSATFASAPPDQLKRQSQRIKMVAYSSMARVAGPRRAWARALLFKLQTRPRHRTLMRRKRRPSTSPDDQVGKLRRLLPGGETMDVCTLLEETANYIHCLSTQVKVMKAISDQHLSTPN
ncbi:transcription factor IBH1 [Cucumis melo var. makuwa]|uniref:Transcription factor IBH1 n=2 Tax=Cucumis melo TaxID=3656 RepID=A0A1S3CLD3_CUCME|nr:transcription factor IBH1 [Cucumis melo]KAA0031737.1 transcription factor IBH1 [Cucumis melo var. makuwa]TYK01643.1 transcription factor IBH1 [Cucumis melo var. makuwa]